MKVVEKIPDKIRSIIILFSRLDEEALVFQSRKKITTVVLSSGENMIDGKWRKSVIEENKRKIREAKKSRKLT